ncbi:outer membrane protein, TIGR04327 family [Leptospira broomii serovar Hurstbridge str. 5399]|uniref:Outer membrane protein, TIGR04327 family n=1 Tax=Leptospira broomii serovar Hurstbridge str. 5399 TaxID=1049789 RepID=T0F1F4_9LEPT|nr:hypothetical protein [Leptospira broomii]EQA44965.1 outer membrane protein, TIGR04327 family [Leptospira broomii serovar Hurstbridge str. 5399]
MNLKSNILLFPFLILILNLYSLSAETILLRDGTMLTGNVKGQDAKSLTLKTRQGEKVIEKSSILKVLYNKISRKEADKIIEEERKLSANQEIPTEPNTIDEIALKDREIADLKQKLDAERKKGDINQKQVQEKSNHTMEFTVRRADYTYNPQEYDYIKNTTNYNVGLSDLSSREKVLPVFGFMYWNNNYKIGFDLSYYQIVLTDSTYNAYTYLYPISPLIIPTHLNFPVLTRTDYQADVFKFWNPTSWWTVGAGGGLRAIDTKQSTQVGLAYTNVENRTYGPQAEILTRFDIWDRLRIDVKGKYFHSEGKQIFEAEAITLFPPSYVKAYGPDGVRARFVGYEYDIGLSIRISGNVYLSFGYNRTFSTFTRVHGYSIAIPYSVMFQNNLNNIEFGSSHNDEIRGYYTGITIRTN